MMSFDYIHWNPDLVIFNIGPLAIRWYSTCWLIGLLLSFFTVKYLYRKQNLPDEKFEPLFLYCFIGILIGARLGHCLFYEPGYFLSSGTHIIEMLLPIRQDIYGSWHFTGYEGLASHGGTIGIMLALLLYSKNLKVKLWTVFDTISISVPITACFIRLGNLMNSEIIGKPTDLPWAFIFERVDMLPRHPGQLYEAIAYFCFFFVLWHFWLKRPKLVGTGFFFGLDILLIFTFRFFIEYTKEVQEAFEQDMLFDMGQLLSIPFIIIGAYFTIRGWKQFTVHNS
ncbi:MAG: prolipoprotein diacylglyceryl transferase [Prevotella sp.]|nr:prolipoprotein diacylglyceryl transferase [Prevotella sp.]